MTKRPAPEQPRAVIERDAALARIGRTRRWVLAGTAALTAGAAGLVSVITPGRSLGAKSASASEPAVSTTAAKSAASSPRAATEPQMPPLADPSSLGLSGPSQPPSAATSTDNSAPTPVPDQSAPSQPQSNAAAQSQAAPAPAPAPVPAQPPVVSGGS